MESLDGREAHNTLSSSPFCHSSNNLGLGVKLEYSMERMYGLIQACKIQDTP